ncbi:amidase [uncultured Enterovirga sp.]|uniref:amidase n=1 Tax=uncultured Enterovirga sp. TaxID=2026352 RepID=UPI0035CB4039
MTRSSTERLEEAFERATQRDHVFTRLYPEAARDAAAAADARRRAGISLGPLDGAIVSIKDLFDVAGEVTLAGSQALRGSPPADTDAAVLRRLRRAGAVVIGRTNMVEFAFSGLGLNPHTGTPGNAVDPALIPGGSSSGAGVSVALGSSEIAIGSDTGGSVRIPAALNGVVGFKPTARRVPLDGAYPLSPSLDSIGPLARTVAECASADAVMAGAEPQPLEPCQVAGLRIGVPRGLLFGDTEPVVTEAFERSLETLSRAGAHVVALAIDDLLEAMSAALPGASIAAIEAAAVHVSLLHAAAGDYDPRVRSRILRGAEIPAAAYLRTMQRRVELIAAMDRRLASVDAFACPATATTAPAIAPLLADEDAYHAANMLMLRNTAVGNLFDLCSITLPMAGTPRPAGFMLTARSGQDERLLSIAAACEGLFRR